MHRGLRIPHLRKGDDSPLRIWLLHWIRNACHTQRLPTPRRRRYGHNVTSPTRLRHSTAEWFTRSLRLCSRDARCVRAISRGTCVEICDAVRVTNLLAQLGDYANVGVNAISVVDANSFWVDGYF